MAPAPAGRPLTLDPEDRPAATEPLLDAAAVAGLLSVRPKRVYELGIPAVRVSTRCVRWRRADVAAWIDSRCGRVA